MNVWVVQKVLETKQTRYVGVAPNIGRAIKLALEHDGRRANFLQCVAAHTYVVSAPDGEPQVYSMIEDWCPNE